MVNILKIGIIEKRVILGKEVDRGRIEEENVETIVKIIGIIETKILRE